MIDWYVDKELPDDIAYVWDPKSIVMIRGPPRVSYYTPPPTPLLLRILQKLKLKRKKEYLYKDWFTTKIIDNCLTYVIADVSTAAMSLFAVWINRVERENASST